MMYLVYTQICCTGFTMYTSWQNGSTCWPCDL